MSHDPACSSKPRAKPSIVIAKGGSDPAKDIRKLLGKRVFDEVAKEERERISEEAARFLQSDGFGVTFQKDAWLGLSSSGNYKLEWAKAGKLKSTFKRLPEVPLFGAPPTRLLGSCRCVLQGFLQGADRQVPKGGLAIPRIRGGGKLV